MSISAKQVAELRQKSGAGMMDCKKALLENEGDMAKAIEYLQKKNLAAASKRADKVAAEGAPPSVQSAFNTMRLIVTIGWAIYPLGYFFGYMTGGVDANSLNLIYNVADVVNKIGFCLAIWAAATSQSEAAK